MRLTNCLQSIYSQDNLHMTRSLSKSTTALSAPTWSTSLTSIVRSAERITLLASLVAWASSRKSITPAKSVSTRHCIRSCSTWSWSTARYAMPRLPTSKTAACRRALSRKTETESSDMLFYIRSIDSFESCLIGCWGTKRVAPYKYMDEATTCFKPSYFNLWFSP